LQVHEGPRELDETFVEQVIRLTALCKPEFFQNVMRFVKELLVEALEIAEVVRIARFTLASCDQRRNFF